MAVVLLVSAVITGESSLPVYARKVNKYPAVASHSFNSKFGCLERQVLFERLTAFLKRQ
jgi:hypothetical protein